MFARLFFMGMLSAGVVVVSLASLAEDGISSSNEQSNGGVNERIINALMSALTYMRENYQQLNLDAITGLRIVQGQLDFLQRYSFSHDLEILGLQTLVQETIELGLPVVQDYDIDYYNRLKRLVDADFWEVILEPSDQRKKAEKQFTGYVLEFTSSSFQSDVLEHDSDEALELLDEDVSDRCIEEVLNQRCNISGRCIQMMTEDGVRGYTATHQVYYFIILLQAKCSNIYTLKKMIKHAQSRQCARIYVEALSSSKQGDIQKDLFMEQVGLCGLAGYYHPFSTSVWIDNILNWQRPEGCYGRANSFLSELEILDEQQRFRRDSSQTRVRREERIMDGGCLCHRTTVALIALIQNYKAMVERVPDLQHL